MIRFFFCYFFSIIIYLFSLPPGFDSPLSLSLLFSIFFLFELPSYRLVNSVFPSRYRCYDIKYRVERRVYVVLARRERDDERRGIFSQSAHFPRDKIPFRWKTVLKADRVVLQADKRRYPVSVEAWPIGLFSSRYETSLPTERREKLSWFHRGKNLFGSPSFS